jgi:hypothetical protein
LRRGREERRRLLTRGERVVAWSAVLLPAVVVLVAVLVLAGGAGGAVRVVCVGLLIVGLVVMAVPVSPFLRARVRRREGRTRRE